MRRHGLVGNVEDGGEVGRLLFQINCTKKQVSN